MADDYPEPQCSECDALRVYVDQARKARDRVQRNMVERYPFMNYNQALAKHAEAQDAAESLTKAERKLLTHWDRSHAKRTA
mgnify:CR=1 FL=1